MAAAAPGGGDVFDLGFPAPAPRPAAVPRPEEPFADLWTPPAPAAPAAPAPPAASAAIPAPAAVAVAEAAEEPEPADIIFPGLASRESRSRYLRALAAEGLFAFDLTEIAAAPSGPAVLEPAPPPVAAEPEPQTVPEAVPEPVPEPVSEPVMAFHEESAVELAEPEEPVAAVAGFSWEVVEEPAVELEPALALAPEPAWAAPEEPVFEIAERTPWAAEPEPVVPEPEPPVLEAPPEPVREPEPAPAAGPVATVTLGELYLRQDHPGEARRIFEEVLRREPDNAVAREALAELASRQRPVAARDLLAGYEPGEEGGVAEAKARKVFLLNSYLKRLRRGSQRDVS
jgi:hypothetical protein